MKVLDLPFVPPVQLPHEKKVEAKAPSASGAAGAATANVEGVSSGADEQVFKCIAATPEEIAAKKRQMGAAITNNLGPDQLDLPAPEDLKFKPGAPGKPHTPGKPRTGGTNGGSSPAVSTPKPTVKPKPTVTPKPTVKPKPITPTPTKPTAVPNTPSGVVSTAQNIVSQPQNLPPAPPSVAASVRNAFITASANNIISSPFTVGQQFTSNYFQNKFTAQSQMPGAPVQNADGTIGTVDPAATKEQKMEARLTGAEIKNEATANLFIFLNLGAEANAVQPSDQAPKDTDGRLKNLEASMDAIEEQMPELAKRFKLLYEPYEAAESSVAPTEESRMDNIEKRQEHINEMINLLKIVQNQRSQKTPGV